MSTASAAVAGWWFSIYLSLISRDLTFQCEQACGANKLPWSHSVTSFSGVSICETELLHGNGAGAYGGAHPWGLSPAGAEEGDSCFPAHLCPRTCINHGSAPQLTTHSSSALGHGSVQAPKQSRRVSSEPTDRDCG